MDICRQFLENYAAKEFKVNFDGYYQAVDVMCDGLADFESTLPTMEEKQTNDELKGFQKLLKNIKKGD